MCIKKAALTPTHFYYHHCINEQYKISFSFISYSSEVLMLHETIFPPPTLATQCRQAVGEIVCVTTLLHNLSHNKEFYCELWEK